MAFWKLMRPLLWSSDKKGVVVGLSFKTRSGVTVSHAWKQALNKEGAWEDLTIIVTWGMLGLDAKK